MCVTPPDLGAIYGRSMSTLPQGPAFDYAAGEPRMNRQERVIFLAYVVMGTIVVTFLAATSATWLL